MQFIADLAAGLHPFALVGPALGPTYYCWRNGLAKIYLFSCAMLGAIAGLCLSPSIQGVPDQPFISIIPASVFVATIVALLIQTVRDDWIDYDPPSPQHPGHFRSTSQR